MCFLGKPTSKSGPPRAKRQGLKMEPKEPSQLLEPEIKQMQTTERGKAAERKQKLGSMGERLCYGINGI